VGSFRFRKTSKVASGVRLNINKKSIGLSVGGRGARISVNTDGRSTRSFGVPGSGLYWRDQSGPTASRPQAAVARPIPSAELAETQRRLAEVRQQLAEANKATLERIASVSINVPALDGDTQPLSFQLQPEQLELIQGELVDERIAWEGGSASDLQEAGDPKYADWTALQVAQAEVEQRTRLFREILRELVVHTITTNSELVAAIGEEELSRAAERLADAIEVATK
jgi:hypothetical protein